MPAPEPAPGPATGHPTAEWASEARRRLGTTRSRAAAVTRTVANRARRLWQARPRRIQIGVLGWAPILAITIAGGLAVIQIADSMARGDIPFADVVFWVGLGLMAVPVAGRLASGWASRHETILLVLFLGVGFYLVKILHSPTMFTFPDEFVHWRTTEDILRTQHLFAENPLLPVSARFPGLEEVTALVVEMTRMSLFEAGLLVAGIARVVLIMSLYFLVEAAAHSRRIAGLATLVYMTNPNFLFFGAAFKYETLALAFTALALFLLVRRARSDVPAERAALAFMAVGAVFGAVTSHHLISYVIGVFLLIWAAAAALRRRGSRRHVSAPPTAVIGVSVAIAMAWLVWVAPITVPYLAPVLLGALDAGLHLIGSKLGFVTDAGSPRELFTTTAGAIPSPAWERAVAIAAVAVILVGLVWGGWRILTRFRTNPLVISMLAASAAYPATLLFRLTQRGWETSNRSSEVLFVAIGIVLAVGFVALRRVPGGDRVRIGIVSVSFAIMLIGGVFAGWAYQWRLPWPYLTGEGPRAVDRASVAAAEWMLAELGPGNRVGADAVNRQVLGSLGEQQTMSTVSGGIDPLWVIYSPVMDADRISLLREGEVRYLLIDHRLAARPDLFRGYFPEPDVTAALSKFDTVPGVTRIYDGGAIAIYDVRALSRAP